MAQDGSLRFVLGCGYRYGSELLSLVNSSEGMEQSNEVQILQISDSGKEKGNILILISVSPQAMVEAC